MYYHWILLWSFSWSHGTRCNNVFVPTRPLSAAKCMSQFMKKFSTYNKEICCLVGAHNLALTKRLNIGSLQWPAPLASVTTALKVELSSRLPSPRKCDSPLTKRTTNVPRFTVSEKFYFRDGHTHHNFGWVENYQE